MTRSSRSRARMYRVTRSLLTSVLIFVGVTCRDMPTEPKLVPGGGMASASNGLTITPANDTILVGQVFGLSVKNANGSAITKTATWTSSDTTIARVVSTGLATATVTGRRTGAVTITAVSQTKSGTNTTTVFPVPVRSVTVTPDSVSLQRGDSTTYTATPKDSAGNALTGRVVTWSVVDTSVAKVNGTGKVLTYARGTTQVQATSEGKVGSARINVRVPQLLVAALTSADSANAGDTIAVGYSVQNAWDAPNADSVIVRVGLRSAAGVVAAAVRRALPRVPGGASNADTARIVVGQALASGPYTVVAYVDCKDAAPATNEARLTDCLATPATAGSISEGNETDNSRSASVWVRGPDLTVASVSAPDSLFTRTTITANATIANAGSSTGASFDVVAGLYDVTASAVISAAATTTPSLGSRQSRAVAVNVPVPAGQDPSHTYEVRFFADCKDTGAPVNARLSGCYANPATAGAIAEQSESNNSGSRAAVVASNVARIDLSPDSLLMIAIGDTTSLAASAYDRANAPVAGVTYGFASLDPAIVSVTGGVLRSVTTGTARIVASAEGRTDTSRVYVTQQIASVLASPDTAFVNAIGATQAFTAAVYDRNHNVIPGAPATWISLDPAVASVNATGTATAITTGVARIVATSGVRADTSRLSVAQQVTRVVVTPDGATLVSLGDTIRVSATALDANGNPAAASFTWSSLDPAVATVSPAGTATAASNGVARIVATTPNGRADTSRVIVQQQVARVSSSPESAALSALGETAQLSATITDARSNAVVGAVASWTSLDPSVASVTSSGLVTALSVGSARIVLASAGVADTTTVAVQQVATRVVTSPDSVLILAPGDTARFSATAYDNTGSVIPDAVVTWTSLDPDVATVASSGTVTSIVTGIARIVGSANGHADTSRVYVTWDVVRIDIAPDTMHLTSLGDTSRFTATAYDYHGNVVPGTWITWASLDPAVAPINEHGVVTAAAVGTGRVTGMVNGRAPDTAVVVVQQIPARVVATPDSVVLTSIGASAVFNAAAYDGRGNAIVGAALSWTSLDPSIAAASGGTVIAQGPGRARVVVSDGAVADTVYAIVAQQVASVAISADTTALAVGGSAQLTAVARDAQGNVMTGETIAWQSQNSAVASVGANGGVSAVAEGITRLVASASGRSDTAVVIVNPQGYTLRWLGNSSSWADAANWYPHQTPDSTTSAYVPAGTANAPAISVMPASVGAFRLAQGATVSGDTLHLHGDVIADGLMAAAVNVRRPLSMRGNFDIVFMDASVTLAGRAAANRVFVENGGSLELAGHTLDASSFSTYAGALTMSSSADSLITREYAQFYGLANLSAGTMVVNGMFNISTSGVPGAAWNVSGTHKVVFAGTQPQAFVSYDTAYVHFQNIEIRNTQGLAFSSQVRVGGLLRLVGGGRVTGDYNAMVRYYTQMPDVSGGSYELQMSMLSGPISLTRNVAIGGSVFVDNGGSLRLAGHTLDAMVFGTYSGALTMDTPADTLIARQYAQFFGLSNLSAGAMILRGDAMVSTSPSVPGGAWNESGTHKLVFDGSAPQAFNFQDSTLAVLNDVEIRNPQGVSYNTSTTVRGLLRLVAGGRLSTTYSAVMKYPVQLPDISQGVYDAQISMVTGPIDVTRDVVFPASLFVDGGGQLRLNGHTVDAQVFGTYYAFQHIGILSLEFHVDKLSRPLL